ncbi:hypothetical protein RvY_14668-2 [Ramazzottius varieornatus]|uniref:Uncharacterized protein n=1 Tax=Ramazzottius varieornatus TaxID=947166 RepID=A0A1D1VZC7_RAMVA|nr:hypothetical protein RvY_14668-2 [Ramazzottius varieornatus]
MSGKAVTKKEPFSGRFGKISSEQNGVPAKRTKLPESQPLHPPLTNLALIPYEIAWPLTKKACEDVIADVLRGKTSTIVVDAGTTKVQARLYGGYHPDWVTGGIWANSSAFISCINKFCKDKKFNFTVTFDSSIDVHNLDAWLARMEWEYESVKNLFAGQLETSPRSLTHPPGAFTKTPGDMWFAPTALQTSLRLICLSMGIKLECTLFEHEPEIIAVRDLKDPSSKSIMDEAGAFFTNSLEYMCYSDVTQTLYWGETLKLNMRGDRMTGKAIEASEVSKSLGVIRDSLDAGLLYYGTRYFKDESCNLDQVSGEELFDPTEDLHHEILAALTANDQKPAARLHTAVEIMQQVHKEGVNNKETMKIGESLLPSMEHLERCLKERTSLPPHFQHLTSSDIYDSDKVEDELQKLRKKASNLFFDIGKRLLEGRTWPTRKPYYERQSPDHPWERVEFPHQRRLKPEFREHLEKFHRSGNIHEWIGHLVFSEN